MQMNINENGNSPRNADGYNKRQKPQGRLFDDFLEGDPSSYSR